MSITQTLGKHEIRRQLGRGAMGIVYEGWDPVIKRRVAIKTVRLPETPDDETADEIARFRREAEAAGRLNHPNIVGVFDYGETADLAYIVMEFVDGPTLKSLLDKHETFPLPRIARIMEDLLAGLRFSHERGVVHRDIKPANVMLTASGQTKIADFGIARIDTSSMTQTGAVLGTPAYMSPEQFMGKVVDARSDIYSAGVLLYQLLTGKRPFDGGVASIMQQALNTDARPPSRIAQDVPARFDEVIRTAMAKSPEDRFASAIDFAAAIRHAMEAPPDPAEETTLMDPVRWPEPAAVPPASVSRAGPTRRVAIGAGLACLIVALGGLGYFLLPRPAAEPPRQLAAVTPAGPPMAGATSGPVVASAPVSPLPAAPPPEETIASGAATPVSPPATEATSNLVPPAAAPESVAPVAPPPESPRPLALADPSPTPPPPVPQSPLDRARSAARGLACAAVNVTSDPDGLHLSGFAHPGADLDRFRREAGAVSDDIGRADRFSCGLIDSLAAVVRRSWDNDAGPLSLRFDPREPVVGGRARTRIGTAAPFHYLDRYRENGNVEHLIVAGGGSAWEPIAARDAGLALYVAYGTAAPLDLGQLRFEESAAAFLDVLRARLNDPAVALSTGLAMLTVRPPEPAPKPRPVEPAAARPPSLHSARCSNIVSRAQLGETLTNAELMALRTECRS